MISVLILTYNEEQNLPACLDSVRWSDDVLVLDSFSTDATVALARARGARVLQHPFVNFAEQRNFGLAHGDLKHPWVLHLDADERVPDDLRAELLGAMANDQDAYRIALKHIFFGRWLRHAGLYPSYQVRFGRRDKLNFVQVGHGQRENLPHERIGTLRAGLVHEAFSKGLEDWFAKHNRYSTAEARHCLESQAANGHLDWSGLVSRDPVRLRRAAKQLSFRLPFRPALRFAYMYFLRLGFLDGLPGYHYCRLLSIYEYMVALKLREQGAKRKALGA